MKIKNHKIVSRPWKGSPYWEVRDANGVVVGSISLSVSANSGRAFERNMRSGYHIVATGPTFHETMRRLEASGASQKTPGGFYLEASADAQKAGHIESWGSSNTGGTKKQAMSAGRVVAREKAWPWLKNLLENNKGAQ
jgi:hypothetical protein